MNRRDALAKTAMLMGSTIVGAQAFLSGCTSPDKKKLTEFTDEVIALLDEIGETIIPTTASSPGAKAAKIGSFMKVIVTDCYSEEEQRIFFDGINTIRETVDKKYKKTFTELSDEDRLALISDLDKEARTQSNENKPEHFFNMLNQLTVWGYFSSEPGATQCLRYVPIPGRYEGCVDYVKGESAWVY